MDADPQESTNIARIQFVGRMQSETRVTIRKLHRVSCRGRDATEARAFHNAIPGLAPARAIEVDEGRGEAEPRDWFFETGEIAFAGPGGDQASARDLTTPSCHYRIVLDIEESHEFKRKRSSHDINAAGPSGCEFIDSIHFFDLGDIGLKPAMRTAQDAIPEKCEAHGATRMRVERDKWQAFT